jgi:hypothetical protein
MCQRTLAALRAAAAMTAQGKSAPVDIPAGVTSRS